MMFLECTRARKGQVDIKALFVCATVFLVAITSARSAEIQDKSLDEFWTLKEFSQINQKQGKNQEPFSARVRAPAVAIEHSGRPVRIAVIYPGQQASDYWRRSLISFEARLAELNLPYEINSVFSGSSALLGNQSGLINEALKTDPDYLVFTLDALRHRPIVERLIARNRPKVILQNITTPVKAWRDRQPFLYVGFDHLMGTEYLIRYYNDRLGPKRPFAILLGPQGYVSRARGNTFLQAYSDPNAANLRASYYVGYDREKSFKAATEILKMSPDLAFIYSGSTDIALGAADAIRDQGRSAEVITNGWGGGSEELDAILKGRLDVTVMRMNDDNGVAMAEAVALDVTGRGEEVPVVYSGDFVLVTSDDTEAKIEKLKGRAFRYSK